MKNIFLIIFTISTLAVSAQYSSDVAVEGRTGENNGFESSSKTMIVYTTKFNEGVAKLDQFINTYHAAITKSNKSESMYEVNFRISTGYVGSIDSLAERL